MVFSRPTFSGIWGSAADPGFGLAASEVPSISAALPGCALTVEHNALNSILDEVAARPAHLDGDVYRQMLGQMDGGKRSVGSVIGARGTEVTVGIDSDLEGLVEMVEGGYLNGLSLTTVRDASGQVRPLEMTLTNTPARGNEAKLSYQYKRNERRMLTSKMSDAVQTPAAAAAAPAETPTAEPTALEAAVASLSEEHRAAVLERLSSYETAMKSKDASTEEQTKQIAALEQLTKAKEADRDLILAQFRTLQAAMNEAGASEDARRLEGLDTMLQSENNALRDHATSQLVMACSAAFQRRSVSAPPAPAAVPDAAPVEPPAPKRAKLNDAPSDLRNLLRSSF